MTWATVRTGVATLIDTVSGVEPRSRAALGKTDSVTATVIPGDPVIESAGHGASTWVRFIVRVKVAKAKLQESQDALDALIWPTGAGSLIAAINGTPQLGGAVDDVRVEQVNSYEQTADSNEVQADIVCLGRVTA